jgi:hypothetical protein
VVAPINPILRGWVRYFAIGDANLCFGFVKDWEGKKVQSTEYNNRVLLHPHCHEQVHSQGKPVEKPRPAKGVGKA